VAQRVVFCDASPLIGLSLVNGLGWLERLFGVVCITDVVADEFLPGSNKPGEAEIAAAIAVGSIRIVEDVWTEPAFPTLDEGEASILRAAVNQKGPCLVIIDETAGRAVASELGLTVTGVVGVIIAARRRGLIASAKKVFEALLKHDFRLADTLIDAALRSLGKQ
jgi:Predicted nucleic acid-binding protein, contains PIN domain